MTQYAGVMPMSRYRELLTCAPWLQEADYTRLKDFWPMRPKLGQLVAIAMLQIAKDWFALR